MLYIILLTPTMFKQFFTLYSWPLHRIHYVVQYTPHSCTVCYVVHYFPDSCTAFTMLYAVLGNYIYYTHNISNAALYMSHYAFILLTPALHTLFVHCTVSCTAFTCWLHCICFVVLYIPHPTLHMPCRVLFYPPLHCMCSTLLVARWSKFCWLLCRERSRG